jgi:hypothetical protein
MTMKAGHFMLRAGMPHFGMQACVLNKKLLMHEILRNLIRNTLYEDGLCTE